MATIEKKKKQKIKNVGRDVEKMEHVCTIDGDIKWIVQPLWKTLKQKLFKNFKIEVSYDWQFPSAYTPKINERKVSKKCLYPYFIAALFTIVTMWKKPVSIDG